MMKFDYVRSGMVLAVLIVGLAGCEQPRRETSREPVYSRSSQGTAQRNSQRNSQRSSRRSEEECNACGVVSAVYEVRQEGRGTGVGAVLGAVVGGIAGHQVGGGTGKDVATVAGVIGGAVVGNKIEENRNNDSYYEITVDMDRGGERTVTVDYSAGRGIGVGSRVTVSGNSIELR